MQPIPPPGGADARTLADDLLVERLAEDFDQASRCLKVRVYGDDPLYREIGVWRSPAEGLLSVLVYDLPKTVVTVRPDHVARWGRSEDELFELGIKNVRQKVRPRPYAISLTEAAPVMLLSGRSFFNSSLVLCLDKFPDANGPYGSLVVVPERTSLLYYPIRNMDVALAVKLLAEGAHEQYLRGPGSVSPHLYWWREGRLQRQPSEVFENGSHFYPTPEFVDQVLNRLAGG